MPTWIRVKDNVTGDEYDVEQTSLRAGMTPIEGYPENSGPGALARPPKPLVAKGRPPREGPAADNPTPVGAAQTAPTAGNAEGPGPETASVPAVPTDTKETR